MAEMGMQVIPEVRVAVPGGKGVKLEDRLGGVLRVRGLAITTEETYVGWYGGRILMCRLAWTSTEKCVSTPAP